MDVVSVTLDLRAGLTAVHAAAKSLPSNWILFSQCLFCATLADDFQGMYILHYWMSFLAGFGGGVSSSLLVMRPDMAPVSFLASNAVGIYWTLCWWLLNYSPLGGLKRVMRNKALMMVPKACTHFNRAMLIIARVDLLVKLYPDVLLAPIIVGTLAGSGGKLVTDALRAAKGMQLAGSMEWETQSYSSRSSFVACTTYYLAAHYFKVLAAPEAAAIVLILIVGQSLLADITGMACDYTALPFAIIHKLTNIPVYSKTAGAAKQPAAGKAAAAAADPAAALAAKLAANGNGNGKAAGAGAKKGKGKKNGKEL